MIRRLPLHVTRGEEDRDIEEVLLDYRAMPENVVAMQYTASSLEASRSHLRWTSRHLHTSGWIIRGEVRRQVREGLAKTGQLYSTYPQTLHQNPGKAKTVCLLWPAQCAQARIPNNSFERNNGEQDWKIAWSKVFLSYFMICTWHMLPDLTYRSTL